MAKKVIILSGVPGSGKSTWVDVASNSCSYTFSADHYFINRETGEYEFNPANLGKAHGECLRDFAETIKNISSMNINASTLVVDNTNTTAIEMAPYVALAAAYGVPVEIITFQCEPECAFKRGTHGVPLKSIQRMAEQIRNRKLPPFWDVEQRAIFT